MENGRKLHSQARTRLALSILLLLILIAAIIRIYSPLFQEYIRERRIMRCGILLKCLLTQVYLYQGESPDYQYPQSLNDEGALSQRFCQTPLLLCPGKHPHVDIRKRLPIGSEVDYLYMNWSKFFDNSTEPACPKYYPIIWDRWLSNHGGGILIITLDWEVFWDPDAEWLQQFAKWHPEYDIPLPEDLPQEGNEIE